MINIIKEYVGEEIANIKCHRTLGGAFFCKVYFRNKYGMYIYISPNRKVHRTVILGSGQETKQIPRINGPKSKEAFLDELMRVAYWHKPFMYMKKAIFAGDKE